MIDIAPLTGLADGQEAYLVGGTVRDLLLNRRPVDYDVAVGGDPQAFAKRLLASTPGRLVVIGKPGMAVVRVVTAGKIFDICPINGRSIEEDLLQRDFSINAMALSLSHGELVDPAAGRQDLTAGAIRMVSPAVFRKDPVRLLRAYRVAARLGFFIDAGTAAAIAADAFRIENAAGERLRDELFKLLTGAGASAYLLEMARDGLLTCLFPEMAPLKGCVQPPPHRYDVFEHSLLSVVRLEALLEDGCPGLGAHRRKIRPLYDPAAAARLKCAVLLHDIGKPSCRTVDSAGRIHFYGHAARGARMIAGVCRRLRFSRAESTYLEAVVRHHGRLLPLFAQWGRARLSPRATARFFKACGDLSPDLVLHAMADTNAKSAQKGLPEAFRRFGIELIEHFFSQFEPLRRSPPLLDGHDLMRRFGLPPSPLIGSLLDQVQTARLAGAVTTRQEAEALVENILGGRRREDG